MTWYQIATIIILGYFLIGALIVIGMLENSEGRALEMKEWPDKSNQNEGPVPPLILSVLNTIKLIPPQPVTAVIL